jgi:hypothetical protein
MQAPVLDIADDLFLLVDCESMAESKITLPVLSERVSNHIRFSWAVVAFGFVWLCGISVQLYYMNADVKQLLQPHQLEKAAAQAAEPKSQNEVLRIFAESKKSQTPIPPDILASAEKSFIAVSERDPGAWKTVQAFMEYRTYVNSLTFIFPATSNPPEVTNFEITTIPGKPHPQLNFIPHGTPIAGAARLQHIGKPTNPNVKLGPTNLIMSGGAVSFDNMDIAHVIFAGIEIHYTGADLRLEDVFFVNCTFVFDNVGRSRMLAENIISSRNVTFSPS